MTDSDTDKLARSLHAVATQIDLKAPNGAEFDTLSEEEKNGWVEFAERLDQMMLHRWAKPKNEATDIDTSGGA